MSKILNALKGRVGERKAVSYLRRHGYKIVKTNYRCAVGEIDIIALQDGVLVFVEVKARANDDFGMPCEAITPAKRNKIIQSAKYYLVEKEITNTLCRFDCIEVLDGEINHIISAFTR